MLKTSLHLALGEVSPLVQCVRAYVCVFGPLPPSFQILAPSEPQLISDSAAWLADLHMQPAGRLSHGHLLFKVLDPIITDPADISEGAPDRRGG